MNRALAAAAILAAFAAPASAAAPETYAEACVRVIGVPVPDVACDDPAASEVPIQGAGGGKCAVPGHGDSHCFPGTKFLRFTDSFTRNGKDETVTTFMMCRKTEAGATKVYDDIGVIQYNHAKHAACWWSKTGHGREPMKPAEGGLKAYPSPSTAAGDAFWGLDQPASSCVRCHQNGVFLRTPFAMQLDREANKGYARNGRAGRYARSNGNFVPATTALMKRGIACSVNMPAWNRADGQTSPRMVKIDADLYNRARPAPADLPAGAASPAECTRCHYFGVSAGGMNCGTFLTEFETGLNADRSDTASFLQRFWMPPLDEGGAVDTEAKYHATFDRALGALRWCCGNSDNPACRASFGDDAGRFANNPCAACPDCVGGAAAGRP